MRGRQERRRRACRPDGVGRGKSGEICDKSEKEGL